MSKRQSLSGAGDFVALRASEFPLRFVKLSEFQGSRARAFAPTGCPEVGAYRIDGSGLHD